MKRSELVDLVREVVKELEEANVTGGTASFTPGSGAQYATPFAFGKGNKAKKTLTKLGYKKVSRPKRPSHTKGFDYL
jgi:hypothetical protein|tara:strand:+ start:3920 stop:4150 length:231 start_codon:yes stop_codon:yes gene_type:complete